MVAVVLALGCGGKQTRDDATDTAAGGTSGGDAGGASNLGGLPSGGAGGPGGTEGTGGYDICSGPEAPPECYDTPCAGRTASIAELLPGGFTGRSKCLEFSGTANDHAILVELEDYVYVEIKFPKTVAAPTELPIPETEGLSVTVRQIVGGVAGFFLLCDRDPTQSAYRADGTGALRLDDLVIDDGTLTDATGGLDLTLTSCTWEQAEASDQQVELLLTF